jgi:hypothetical protein
MKAIAQPLSSSDSKDETEDEMYLIPRANVIPVSGRCSSTGIHECLADLRNRRNREAVNCSAVV